MKARTKYWASTLRHGHARVGRKSPEYNAWVGMRKRCNNPHARDYFRYGGRGIKVCARWDSFENFLADMGPRQPGTTIERQDNDRDYEPGNCRWATRQEQSCNRSTTRLTADLVRSVRALATIGTNSDCAIARALNVSPDAVRRVRIGESWSHIL